MFLLHYLLLFIVSIALAASDGSNDDPLITKYPGLVSWFTSNGGFIDQRITIGYDDKGIRGMIASDRILKDTLLIHCPGSLVVEPDGDGDGYVNQCAQIENILKELSAGNQSKWHTYFDFDDSLGSRIPSEWDRDMDRDTSAVKELQGLPPTGQTHRHIEWYMSWCKLGEEPTDLEMRAFKIFLTRSADVGLVPMYDLMNHHNGFINTRLERDGKGGLKVIARTDIDMNEPILNTYARSGWESSVDVFNTYGFVEDYPQLWRWDDEELNQRHENDPGHHFVRYHGNERLLSREATPDPSSIRHEPNTHLYEILVISPDIAALYPTKELVSILGNGQRSTDKWVQMIEDHHAILRAFHVHKMQDSIQTLFESSMPTTINQDESILFHEKRLLEKVRDDKGSIDPNKADVIQAIEYRLAFKKAMKLALDIAQAGKEKFVQDSDEL